MNLPRRLPWHEEVWKRLPPLAARGVHAVLLYGAPGIGKKSLAFDFAAALQCAAPLVDGHACGRCDECRLSVAFGHPDTRWVLPQALAETLLPQAPDDEADEDAEPAPAGTGEGEGRPTRASREIRVEQVRELSDFLGIASYRGGRRVVVLAPAEALNAIAANTLLKMLEEPPPATFFVLVADALDDVLPTIRSRCVLLQVPTPAAAACLSWLAGQGVADAAGLLAFASGAPLAALALAADSGSAANQASIYALLERGPALTGAQIVGGVGRDPPPAAVLRLLHCWAVDLLLCRLLGTVRYHPPREARIRQLAAQVSVDALWRWIGRLTSAGAAREHPLNPRLLIEALLAGYPEVFDNRR